MIGVQLLKDSDKTTPSSKKSRRKASRVVEADADDGWFPEDLFEAFKELRNRKVFDVDDMYTLADAWGGWTWEKDPDNRPPRRWSQEWEVELAMEVMLKVIELGWNSHNQGLCLHATIKAPLPSAFLKILQATHSLGYVFGGSYTFSYAAGPLFDEIISLCLDLGELDAAIAIVAALEATGIAVPAETLDRVIAARRMNESPANDSSLPIVD